MQYLTRPLAAQHISERTNIPTTPQALADLARLGRGPAFSIMRGRAVYARDAVDAWIAEQFARGKRAGRQQAASVVATVP